MSPFLKYIKGHKNREADALSRLPFEESFISNVTTMMNHSPMDLTNPLLNKNPLNLELLQECQEQEAPLQQAVQHNTKYFYLPIFGHNLIVHESPKHVGKTNIVLPFKLRYPAIRWLHSIMGHAGVTRLNATLSSHFWFPHMQAQITVIVKLR